MRLYILSDLHNEFQEFVPPLSIGQIDAVILAGDIDLGTRGIEWAANTFERIPVVYVPGNHEFYSSDGRHLQEIAREMQELANWHGIELLNPGVTRIGDCRFIGATLWADFTLNGDDERAFTMDYARRALNDFRLIWTEEPDGEKRQFQPADAYDRHIRERDFLFTEIQKGDPARTVVITHFVPTSQAIEKRHQGDLLSPAFVTDLDDMVENSGVAAWIFGHHHSCWNFRLGSTQLISNQRGYPNEGVKGFDPGLVIKL
ncbi:MAG: metallophosphoesterase [Rhodospirillales bacterium]